MPVVYSVEIVRDGRSFATRTVRSLQKGAVIFILTASFHKPENSPLQHSMPSPVHLVPVPETMHAPSPDEYAKTVYQRIVKSSSNSDPERKVNPIVARVRENSEEFVKSLSEEFASRPIDFRYVSKHQIPPDRRGGDTYRQYVWFKANGAISEDPKVHAVALAYASDHNLLSTSLGWQSRWSTTDVGVMVSLDHIIYFHEV
jgi:acyl-CoA thioesterase II